MLSIGSINAVVFSLFYMIKIEGCAISMFLNKQNLLHVRNYVNEDCSRR